MALTKEGVTSLKNYIANMKGYAEGTKTFDEGTVGAAHIAEYNEATSSADYDVWVAGTDFGAKFEDNLQKITDISNKLREQYKALVGKLESYVQIQESINSGGEN